MTETFYDVLEVPADADEREIRRAYRRKVKEWHPDVSDHPDASERFRKIRRAERVLTDPDERDRYDDLGHDAYMEWFDEEGPGTGNGSSGRSTDTDASDRRDSAGSSSADDGGAAGTGGTSSGSASATGRSSSSSNAGASGSSASASGRSASSRSEGSSASSGTSSTSSSASSSASSSSSGTAGQSGAGGSAGSGSAESAATGSASTSGGSGATAASGGTAVSADAVAAEAGRWRKKWQAAARETGGGSGAFSVGRDRDGDLRPSRVARGIATKIRSQDAAVLTLVLLVVYPIFVFASVAPSFPLWTNAAVALATVFVVVYALTEPAVSLVVFGTWSLLTPLLVAFFGIPFLSPVAVFAITASWVPFVLSILLTLAMPE